MTVKALILLAAREHKSSELSEQLSGMARQIYDELVGPNKEVTAMISMAEDMLRQSPAPVRAYDATIELKVSGAATESCLQKVFSGLSPKLESLVIPDLSALLVGVEKRFTGSDPAPIRYQYLMRRRYDFRVPDIAVLSLMHRIFKVDIAPKAGVSKHMRMCRGWKVGWN